MKKLLLLTVLFITAALFYSCSASYTDISGTWTKPGYSGKKYNKILVVAITDDIIKRSNVESAIVKEFEYNKIKAGVSSPILDFSNVKKDNNGKVDSTDRDKVINMVLDAGYDGALIVSLLDVKEKSEYVPGQTYYQPLYYGGYGGYYGGFYGYSYNTYGVVSSPGYYTQKKYIYIETRLFDLKTDVMNWAAKSETKDPSDLKDFSNSLASAVVNTLSKDGIVK